MLEILFISTYTSIGGAARATLRIFDSLKSLPLRLKMFTASKLTHNENIYQVLSTNDNLKLKFAFEILKTIRAHTEEQHKILISYGQASAGVVDQINADSSNIVHLHWVCNYLSIQDIARINKPVIWTLHDMWPFGGIEHINYDSDAFFYTHSIQNHVENSKSLEVFKEKVDAWQNKNFTIVAPSNWLASCAKKSILFHMCDIQVIPIPIDTIFWRPLNYDESKSNFPFDPTKFQILFIGQNMINDSNKGWDLILESLKHLINDSNLNFELILVGHEGEIPQDLPFSVLSLGNIKQDNILVQLYSAVHVLAMPSRNEAFSLVTCEAQACGLPVVGFKIGGIPDIVVHQKTGWIAKPFDTYDFAKGIEWVLKDQQKRKKLSLMAREHSIQHFSNEVISKKYNELYKNMVKN
jgi:glycosyltransferase involved in cell wall biosynthesis